MRRRRRWHEITSVRSVLGLHSPSLAVMACCACRRCRPDATWRDRMPAGQRRLRAAFAEKLAAGFRESTAAQQPGVDRAVTAMLADARRTHEFPGR